MHGKWLAKLSSRTHSQYTKLHVRHGKKKKANQPTNLFIYYSFSSSGNGVEVLSLALQVHGLDLSTVVPCVSGPKRPQDRVSVSELKEDFQKCLDNPVRRGGERGGERGREGEEGREGVRREEGRRGKGGGGGGGRG